MGANLIEVEVPGPSGRTYELWGPKGDHQVNHWRAGHFYEGGDSGVLKWAWDNPQYFERVVDIGASLGNHSVFFAGELGAEVIAIEPYTSDIVQKNVDENGLCDRVTVKRELIGANGSYTMSVGPENNVGTTSFSPDDSPDATHFALHLKSVIKDFRPTAIKIDAEGMSIDALTASMSVVIYYNPVVIMEAVYDADLLMADALLIYHNRLPQVFNATPTYVWIPS